MSTGYVYLLANSKGFHYVGSTGDLERRLDQHNAGYSDMTFTRRRGPWKLVGYETLATLGEARKRERTLKRNPNMFFLFKKRLLTSVRPASGGPRQVVG